MNPTLEKLLDTWHPVGLPGVTGEAVVGVTVEAPGRDATHPRLPELRQRAAEVWAGDARMRQLFPDQGEFIDCFVRVFPD